MGVKVLTVFGTRPEAIKLFPLIHALEADPRVESRVCVTGQHRGLLDSILQLAEIEPDFDMDLMSSGQPLAGLAGRILCRLPSLIEREQPDWVVVQGDTTSGLAAALAAHYADIPVCHVEAGLRSGDNANPWPEEANRRMISVLADLHCAPTQGAAAALQREGIASAAIEIPGNTGIDALYWVRERLRSGRAAAPALAALKPQLRGRKLVLATLHRRENQGVRLRAIAEGMIRIAARGDALVVLPLHPSPEVSGPLRERMGGAPGIVLLPPLDYPDFVAMLDASWFVISDSGGLQEEAPALGTPTLVLRNVTERPEAIAAGVARLVGTDTDGIVAAAAELLDDPEARRVMARAVSPFGDGHAAPRIVERLADGYSEASVRTSQIR